MKISAKTAKALQVIRDHKVTAPSQFARLLWPDAPGWKRSSTVGRNSNGSAKGTGMRLGGGGYLAKLRKRGLIYGYQNIGIPYYLSKEGKESLDEWEKANPQKEVIAVEKEEER